MKRVYVSQSMYIFLFFCIIVIWGIASTEVMAKNTQQLRVISLEKAIDTALTNNYDYTIAVYRRDEAKEQVNAAWGALMPALESEASATRQSAENGFMSLSDGQYDIKFVQLRFGINPGQFYNSLQVSRNAYMIAQEDVRRIKSEIEFQVISYYFDSLLAKEMITLHRDSIELLKSNLRDVKNLYRTGRVPRFDVLQAEVRLKSQEPLLLEAQNNYSIALDRFNYVLGSKSMEYLPDESQLRKSNYQMPEGSKQGIIGSFSQVALMNRPEVVQLEKREDLTRHARNVQSSYYLWPTFSITGYYGKTKYLPNEVDTGIPAGPTSPDFSQISGSSEWQNTWQVRVAATYRWGALLPVDRTRAQEREETLRMKETEQELVKLKRLIVISIRSHYTRLVTAYDTIQSQRDNVKTAREGLRIAKESYKAGVINNSELLAAELSLTNARTSYINAVHSYYISLAGLKKEMGISDNSIIMKGAE